MQLRPWLALLLLIGSAQVFAQVQVREAGTSRAAAAQLPAQPQSANTELMTTLYTQMEALQQEVQTLRGIVEEQGYQLKRMQNEQKDRYLDIDRRLGALSTASAPNANQPAVKSQVQALPPPPTLDTSSAATSSVTTLSTQPAPPPSNSAPVGKKGSVGVDNGLDEQELYRTALNMLIQENKAEASVPMFQAYIDAYPKGKLFTNALYWQGEAYLAMAAPAKAREVFMRLLSEYPADAKAPGAMLKLGRAYKDMGDAAKAADTWKGLKVKYPENPNEIRLAEESLKTLK